MQVEHSVVAKSSCHVMHIWSLKKSQVSRESLKISDEQTLAGAENGPDKQLQGLRMDLTNYLPPKIGQKILGQVLSDSLSVLVVR